VPYRVTTVTGRKFFGTTPTSIEGTTIQVSDLETLVDCADHPGFCGGIRELACAMRAADEQGCSWETVGEYLERLDNGAATKRIVYLADQLGIGLPTRGARRVVHEWLFPAGPHASRDRVDSQHVPGPHQYRAGHAGADGVLAESANSQRKAACCVTPPSIYRSLHKIR